MYRAILYSIILVGKIECYYSKKVVRLNSEKWLMSDAKLHQYRKMGFNVE